MNLNNIEKGTIGKNYKDMCRILEEPVLEGNSKKAQLKEWKRYFDWDRQGNKFIVTEKYIIQLPEDFSSNDVYSKYIQTILAKYLKENGDGKFTMTQLLKLCGFVNENWNDITALDRYIENENITYAQAKYYLFQLSYHVNTYCRTALIRCLNRLSKRDFLRWQKVLYVQDIDAEGGKFRLATENEYRTYLNILMEVKSSMNIKYINLYNKDEFYRRIDASLEEYGWCKAYELIKIICADKFIDDMVRESEQEYREALFEVNDHCLQQMYKYVDVDIENDIKKLADKGNIDIELARLWSDEEKKKKKLAMADFFIMIKDLELAGKI